LTWVFRKAVIIKPSSNQDFLRKMRLALDFIIRKGRKKGFSERISRYNEHGLWSDWNRRYLLGHPGKQV